jgi:hypothetical protein
MALNARPTNPFEVKALAFDVFGTVVDWRGSIIREGAEWGRAKGLEVDWAGFADRWRAGYGPSMDKVRRGTLPWMNLDALHRIILDDLPRVRSYRLDRSREGPLESSLAPADALAGRGRGPGASQGKVRAGHALER